MRKVYLTPPAQIGRGIKRVAAAIAEFAPPGIEIVPVKEGADLVIHHVAGLQNFGEVPMHGEMERDQQAGRRSAIVQYCLRTSENPDTVWWHEHVWRHCDVVWSYYDIAAALTQDGYPGLVHPWLYHAPLGVDPVFHGSLADRPKHPIYLVCTSGYIPETEGVLECVEAAARVGGRVLHLGPRSLNLGPHVTYAEGVSDAQLAALYKSCRYVAGLRRIEGFELPAAEGLCGGTIPICFDQPHYRRWFEDSAIYVEETDPATVTDRIETIFRFPEMHIHPAHAGRLDQIDIALAQRKFSWPRVVKGFWDRILHPVQTLSAIDELPHAPTADELADLHRPDVDIPF